MTTPIEEQLPESDNPEADRVRAYWKRIADGRLKEMEAKDAALAAQTERADAYRSAVVAVINSLPSRFIAHETDVDAVTSDCVTLKLSVANLTAELDAVRKDWNVTEKARQKWVDEAQSRRTKMEELERIASKAIHSLTKTLSNEHLRNDSVERAGILFDAQKATDQMRALLSEQKPAQEQGEVGEWLPITGLLDLKCGPILVTNNPQARDAHGNMSHLWLTRMIHQSGGEYTAFCDGSMNKVRCLTHYMVVLPPTQSEEGEKKTVTVCDKCLTAACWQGRFMCQESQSAGTVEKTIEELKALDREHPDNWRNPQSEERQQKLSTNQTEQLSGADRNMPGKPNEITELDGGNSVPACASCDDPLDAQIINLGLDTCSACRGFQKPGISGIMGGNYDPQKFDSVPVADNTPCASCGKPRSVLRVSLTDPLCNACRAIESE